MNRVRVFGRKFISVLPLDIWGVDLVANLPPPTESRFELKEITSPDDPLLDDLDTDTFDRAYYRKCLARGDRGYAALDGTICAGRTWVTTVSHRDPWIGLRVAMGPEESWSFGSWVEPRYRRGGAISLLLAHAIREAHRHGATHLYGAAESRNTPMHTVALNVGWYKREHVVCARILNRIGVQVPFTLRPRTGPAARRS